MGELVENWERAQVRAALGSIEPLRSIALCQWFVSVNVVVVGERVVRVVFSDGLVRELDFAKS